MLKFIESISRKLALRFIQKLRPRKIIVVVGSVGKTSTTQAVAHCLRSAGFRVCSTRHNYNTNIGVPASIFGLDLPKNAKNPFVWLAYFARARRNLSRWSEGQFEYFVLELGTDCPGEISQFAWLNPDIAIVSAIAPEHMENFEDLDAVADEELSVSEFSKLVLINTDSIDKNIIKKINHPEIHEYNRDLVAKTKVKPSELQIIGEHSLDALSAGVWILKNEGVGLQQIRAGLRSFVSPPGRMRKFPGVQGSTIIDDSYNSSPEAAIAALQYIYSLGQKRRIVILGNMNELGKFSEPAHKELGEYCNKTKLDLVVTLGPDANKFTAKTAKQNGCNVARADTPKESAEIVLDKMHEINEPCTVLVKGSQNKVYAEEAVKLLLKNSKDQKSLVRQSPRWRQIKGSFWVDRED